MKCNRWATLVTTMAGLTALALPAAAQFDGFDGNARYTPSGRSRTTLYGSVAFFPFAPFASAGRFSDSEAGSQTDFGMLAGANFGIKPAHSPLAYEIGGWYWTKGSSDLYQVQGRAYFARDFGFQVGYLGSTSVSGNAWDMYLLYDLTSKVVAPRARRKWGIKTGLGLFIDPSEDRTTSSFSLFIEGGVEIAPRLSLNASQWYVRDRSADLNRFALGIGYAL